MLWQDFNLQLSYPLGYAVYFGRRVRMSSSDCGITSWRKTASGCSLQELHSGRSAVLQHYRSISAIIARVRVSSVSCRRSRPSIFHESNLKRLLTAIRPNQWWNTEQFDSWSSRHTIWKTDVRAMRCRVTVCVVLLFFRSVTRFLCWLVDIVILHVYLISSNTCRTRQKWPDRVRQLAASAPAHILPFLFFLLTEGWRIDHFACSLLYSYLIWVDSNIQKL